MTVKLIIRSLEDGKNQQEFEFEQSLISCGRSRSCLVSLEHEGISRRHFIIKYEENKYILVDENSHHGTSLDGRVLSPSVSYTLLANHHIQVPGFLIEFSHNAKPPCLEKTSVVARKLMGQIFNQSQLVPDRPYLEDEAKIYRFTFDIEKPLMLLGASSLCDFVIDQDNTIYPQHSSFIRDINGVRIIPIGQAKISVNGHVLQDAKALYHGDIIIIGSSKLIFHEYSNDDKALLSIKSPPPQDIGSEPESALPNTPKSRWWLKRGDAVFRGLFVLALVGLSVALFKLA